MDLEGTVESLARSVLEAAGHSSDDFDKLWNSKVKDKVIMLDNPPSEKESKLPRKKKNAIKAKEKRNANLFTISPENRRYVLYLPLHELWKQYMLDFIPATVTNKTQILGKVLKADYHGCILKAVRCKNPSIVGKEGILVQETENTFKIITRQDRLLTIPKENTVFNFELPPPHKEIITLYGNQLCFRSADRSLRKYKFKPTVEL